jgi:para-aminobenzoate synthetase component 1
VEVGGSAEPLAWFGGLLATGLAEVSDDPAVLDRSGRWAVVLDFEGAVTLARFDRWRPTPAAALPGRWRGADPARWQSSLDRDEYCLAVAEIRRAIGLGEVYQANLCRVMHARLPDPDRCHPFGLARLLATGNPAPHLGALHLPAAAASAHGLSRPAGVHVACASPELYLSKWGDQVESRPIKGTARSAGSMLAKDEAENVMIVDLVRNDLGAIAATGSVSVPEFLTLEDHPGLVHLVSGVRATLRADVGWSRLLAATFPPGSVTGAPKSSALAIIDRLEPEPRGPYCGAIGWVDADTGAAELAVGIRTFWIDGGGETGERRGERVATISFGTGAGITWGSDAMGEWQETELKADHLISVAAGESDPGVGLGADEEGARG